MFGEIVRTQQTGFVRQCTFGIDCHRDSYYLHVYSIQPQSTELNHFSGVFDITETAMQHLVAALRKIENTLGLQIDLGILESTGPYSMWLYERLAAQWPMHMLNPSKLNKYAEKSDAGDAKDMSVAALYDLSIQPNFIRLPQEEVVKRLARKLKRSGKNLRDEANSLGSSLVEHGIGYVRGKEAIQLLSVSSREMLETLFAGETDPRKVAQAATYYSKYFGSADDPREPMADAENRKERKYAHIQDTLGGVPALSGAMRDSMKLQYALIEQCEAMEVALEAELQAELAKYVVEINGTVRKAPDAVTLLDTLPCVGEPMARRLLAEWTLRIEQRFGAPEAKGPTRMASYSGMNPTKQSTGGKEISTYKAVKGATHVRTLLVEAGQAILRSDTPLGEKCRYIAHKHGGTHDRAGRGVAVCAAGNHIARSAYWMLTRWRPYDESQKDYQAAAKRKVYVLKKSLREIETSVTDADATVKAEALKLLAQAAGTQYIINPKLATFPALADVFEKRLLTVLDKNQLTTFGDVWACISMRKLDQLAGIGEKTARKIVTTLVTKKLLQEV